MIKILLSLPDWPWRHPRPGQPRLQTDILVPRPGPGTRLWIWCSWQIYIWGKIVKDKSEFAQSGCEQGSGCQLIPPREILIFLNIMEYCSADSILSVKSSRPLSKIVWSASQSAQTMLMRRIEVEIINKIILEKTLLRMECLILNLTISLLIVLFNRGSYVSDTTYNILGELRWKNN